MCLSLLPLESCRHCGPLTGPEQVPAGSEWYGWRLLGEGGYDPVVLSRAPERDPAPPRTPERLAFAHQNSGSLEDFRPCADQDEVGVRGHVLEACLLESRLEALTLRRYEARPLGDGFCLAHRGFGRGLRHQAHAEGHVRPPDVVRDLRRCYTVADPESREPVNL